MIMQNFMRFLKKAAAVAAVISVCTLSCMTCLAAPLEPEDCSKYEWIFDEQDGWQCLDDDGEPVTGWVLKDDSTYFLDKEGYVRTGWIKHKGVWYYLDEETGVLAKDTWIDNYKVDKDGACIRIK